MGPCRLLSSLLTVIMFGFLSGKNQNIRISLAEVEISPVTATHTHKTRTISNIPEYSLLVETALSISQKLSKPIHVSFQNSLALASQTKRL